MNYTLNQLSIFLKITEAKSITKASEELHLTQPAVSIQLKNFQDQFELPLTEVIGRKLYITEFGWEIAKIAENIIDQVNEINNKTLTYKGQLSGNLKISIVSTGKYIMPYFISEFMKINNGIELKMDVTNKSMVLESLENNVIDFALVSILPNHLKFQKLDLMKNKLYLVSNTDNQLNNNIEIENIKHLPMIFRENGSGTRLAMEKFLTANNIKIEKKMELTSNEAVKQAVIAGLGYSILPLIGIKNELQNKQLKIIQVKGLPIETTWSLIWLKGKKHTLISKAFVDFLEANKVKFIQKYFNWIEKY